MKIGINGSGLLARPDLGVMVDDIKKAEAAGINSYWLAQTGLVDALTVFTVAGSETSSIELGTAVIPRPPPAAGRSWASGWLTSLLSRTGGA